MIANSKAWRQQGTVRSTLRCRMASGDEVLREDESSTLESHFEPRVRQSARELTRRADTKVRLRLAASPLFRRIHLIAVPQRASFLFRHEGSVARLDSTFEMGSCIGPANTGVAKKEMIFQKARLAASKRVVGAALRQTTQGAMVNYRLYRRLLPFP